MRYRIDDTVYDTSIAKREYLNAYDHDGRNQVSRVTNSQWSRECLYLSSKGTWYIERTSAYQGVQPEVRVVGIREAAAWLEFNDHELPPELAEVESVVE